MICENICTYVPHIRYAGDIYISYVKFHISITFSHYRKLERGRDKQ